MFQSSDSMKIVKKKKETHLLLIFESLLTGMLTGLLIAAFRFGIHAVKTLRHSVYPFVTANALLLTEVLAALIVAGLVTGYIITKRPIVKGSGIAQIGGVFMQKLAFFPCIELPLKFIGGILCIGGGLSVGREGPSVQLGAYVGDIVDRISKRSFFERVCLMTAGAAAGLSAAFHAPFTGMVFALEDLHRYFSPLLLVCIMAGSFAADFVASSIFGAGALFQCDSMRVYPLHQFVWLVGLGVFTALVGHLFKESIYFSQKLYEKLRIPQQYRPIIPFLLSLPIGIWVGYAAGGGDEIIEALTHESLPFKVLLVLLAVKIIFTGLSAGSGAIGGVFVPLLACGALSGVLYTKLLVHFGLIDPVFSVNMMFFGMAACFTTVLKTPLSACALILETSGNMYHLGGLVLSSLAAYITANVIGSEGHNHVLLSQFLYAAEANPEMKKAEETGLRSTQIFEFFIQPHSPVHLKKVKEVRWPEDSLIIGVLHGETERLPNGETTLYAGDKLIILAGNNRDEEIFDEFLNLTSAELDY